MFDKIMENSILFYSLFSILCVSLFAVVALIVSKIRNKSERKKLKRTSDTILTEHFSEPDVTTLEEEINKLEEKAKQNENAVVENFEVTDTNHIISENNFIKGEPIQIEIDISDVNAEENDKSMSSILSRMQEDLTKRDEKQIYEFEQEQEENAIISYQELLKANGREEQPQTSKFDLYDLFDKKDEVLKKETTSYSIDNSSDLAIINIEDIEEMDTIEFNVDDKFKEIKENKKVNASIEIDVKYEPKKFKMSEFISPIYGRIESKLEYPTIPSTKNGNEKKSISELTDDEFLNALKAFRQNL